MTLPVIGRMLVRLLTDRPKKLPGLIAGDAPHTPCGEDGTFGASGRTLSGLIAESLTEKMKRKAS